MCREAIRFMVMACLQGGQSRVRQYASYRQERSTEEVAARGRGLGAKGGNPPAQFIKDEYFFKND